MLFLRSAWIPASPPGAVLLCGGAFLLPVSALPGDIGKLQLAPSRLSFGERMTTRMLPSWRASG